jgi:type II secretory pathway component PulF
MSLYSKKEARAREGRGARSVRRQRRRRHRIAALGTMLASGVRLEQAMRIANRAGGIKVAKLGTAVVTRKELFG